MQTRKGFWDYFWFAKFVLRAAGILPIGGPPSLWKLLLSRYLAACPALYGLYLLTPEINYIFYHSHSVDDMLEAMAVGITVFGGQLRSIFIAFHHRGITRLFEVCEKLWDETVSVDYKINSTWAKRARVFSTAYFCAAMFSISAFISATTIKQLSSPENTTTRYYPFHYPEDHISSLEYGIKYTLQMTLGVFGMFLIAAADISGTLLAFNMCGQFAVIRSWLLNMSEKGLTTENEKIGENVEVQTLEKSIRHHQVILDFCSELEEVVRSINLARIGAGMIVLAISGARLTKSLDSTRYFGPLLFSISGLYFTCSPSDNLSFASSEVAEAVYGVPWHRFSPSEKTAVAIMLMRSQRPVKLTAGKFVSLSLETFTSIMANSISFCMVLHRL